MTNFYHLMGISIWWNRYPNSWTGSEQRRTHAQFSMFYSSPVRSVLWNRNGGDQ